MSEESVLGGKVKELYKKLCQDEWDAVTAGIIVAFLSVMIFAWMRPWGAVGAIRNWGEWMIYGLGFWDKLGLWDSEAPRSALLDSGSVIGIGFVAGAFLSANLGRDFALRVPPLLEMIKGLIAGLFMGVGSALAGGCNVGGMFNAIGNLAANGFSMWLGLIIGVVLGLKYLYWEMSNISWGSGGAKTIDFPGWLKGVFAAIALVGLVWGAYQYTDVEAYDGMLSGILIISAGLGYAMQRGRWCMVQAFREPHMTGDTKMAKGVAASIVLVAIGCAVIKYTDLRAYEYYVRGTFGLGGVFGGLVFGFGAMMAGGCGSGSLWRVGEGQIKLWLAVITFGISNAIVDPIIESKGWEGTADGSALLGQWLYLPDTFLGYGGTLALIALIMGAWYVIATWNEETNKLIVEM